MDDQEIPMILPPFDLLFLPPGTYGISYDISTSKTENNLPEGRRITQRAVAHGEVERRLQSGGFRWIRSSYWICDDTHAVDAYWMALTLSWPLSKPECTVNNVKIHYISNQTFSIDV
ncbi:hypothetical protein SCLCIDRAFT_1212083 [Scleroderma citrinum Foug A]|uniref:Uncharacterized protein n=1 Tax=Scleroderma citrinum Foug A TaxID=1036808 RepID=A0A0C3ECM1_9AGAM|nr:hypothetical protein SCLCIDRAFT_1212083 [Scleroderma citrinum Foug A]